ncbi:MAG: superoxide dismutase, Ni [Planctomycetota bacterium]|jgi:nickel superoxide dismutase
MRKSTLLTALIAGVCGSIVLSTIQARALAHCEIPCGIYDDHARVRLMLEDTMTIGKAVDQINQLAGGHDALSVNQAARWTMNKEEHATRIQHTIAQYFMTQRIKPVAEGADGWDEYVTRLAQHHRIMVAAMKCKQTVDPANVERLQRAIAAIADQYPEHRHDRSATQPGRR